MGWYTESLCASGFSPQGQGWSNIQRSMLCLLRTCDTSFAMKKHLTHSRAEWPRPQLHLVGTQLVGSVLEAAGLQQLATAALELRSVIWASSVLHPSPRLPPDVCEL